jgi:acetyl esterase/lipase
MEPVFAAAQTDVSQIERKWLDLAYARVSRAQRLDLFLPAEGDGPFPVIVRIHGGAFEIGDKRDFTLAPWLGAVEHGYALASINYRLSGEALFPAAVQDAKAAVRWLRANASEYRLDPTRMCTVGDSAGGNLAAMVATSAGAALFDDASLGNPAHSSAVQAAVDWFGPMDFFTMGGQRDANGLSLDLLLAPPPGPSSVAPEPELDPASMVDGSPERKYLGAPFEEVPDLVRAANPATYLRPDVPPILIQHGDADPLVPYQQSVDFAAAIERAVGGGRHEFDILEGAGHGTPEFGTEENMKRVFRFLDRYLM